MIVDCRALSLAIGTLCAQIFFFPFSFFPFFAGCSEPGGAALGALSGLAFFFPFPFRLLPRFIILGIGFFLSPLSLCVPTVALEGDSRGGEVSVVSPQ